MMNAHVTKFRTGYFDRATEDLGSVLDQCERHLGGIDFDTIVGTGFSGGVVVPALALRMGVNFVLIRKEYDDSHHGSGRLLGVLGKRWIFVDDFVSSGATRERVMTKVQYGALLEDWETTFVGQYMYHRWVDEDEGYGLFTSVEEIERQTRDEDD